MLSSKSLPQATLKNVSPLLRYPLQAKKNTLEKLVCPRLQQKPLSPANLSPLLASTARCKRNPLFLSSPASHHPLHCASSCQNVALSNHHHGRAVDAHHTYAHGASREASPTPNENALQLLPGGHEMPFVSNYKNSNNK